MHRGLDTDREIDIAIVGAGPAGLMAATVASRAGASVALLDGQGWAGGRLALQTPPLQGPASIYQGRSGVEFCRGLIDEATSAGMEIILNSMVTDLRVASSEPYRFGLTHTSKEEKSESCRAKIVVLATGSQEPWIDFPGSTLRGVMLSGDAQEMLNVRGVLPGKRVIMVGSDNAGLLIAANLLDAGANVVAVVDESPRIIGRELNAVPLRDAGVEVLTSSKLIAAHGDDAVEAVTVDVSGAECSFDLDIVCLAGPRSPESKLAAMAGCSLYDIDIMGGYVPAHNRRMATPVSGLYVCGDAAGVENGAVSLESGRLSGLWAASELGYSHPQAEAQERLARGRLGYMRRGHRGLMRRKAKASLASEYLQAERQNSQN